MNHGAIISRVCSLCRRAEFHITPGLRRLRSGHPSSAPAMRQTSRDLQRVERLPKAALPTKSSG